MLLFVCTVLQPEQQYCYNNVFADLALYGGKPKYKSPYSYVDWFTWSGWFGAYGFHLTIITLKEFLVTGVVIGALLAYWLSNPALPFCVDGDVKIEFLPGGALGAYFDVCKYLEFFKTPSPAV